MNLASGLEYETELKVISIAVPRLCECLPRIAIAEVIHPVVPDRPCMTSRQAPWVIPDQGRRRIGEPLRKCLVSVYHVHPGERSLFVCQVEIQLGDVRVEPHGRGGVEAKPEGVQPVTLRPVIRGKLLGRGG